MDFTGDTGLIGGDQGLGSIQNLVRLAYFKMDSGDCAEVIARQFADGAEILPNLERVCFDFSDSDYSDEVWPIFQLVLSNIVRSDQGPIKHFTIEVDANGVLHNAFGEAAFDDDHDVRLRLHRIRTAENLVFSDGRTGPRTNTGFTTTSHSAAHFNEETVRRLDFGARSRGKSRVMALAVYFAARCQHLAELRPEEGRHLLRLGNEFETYVDGLLEMIRTKHEVELILQSNRRVLASACMVDYIVHHKLRKLAGNRWIQTYLKDVWQSASLCRSVPQAAVLHNAVPCAYKAASKNEGHEASGRTTNDVLDGLLTRHE